MRARPYAVFALLGAIGAALAACGGAGVNGVSNVDCGSPPPVPLPAIFLSYPEDGSTGVATSVGLIILDGTTDPKSSVVLTSGTTTIPAGAYTAPPSPLPTPYATPAGSIAPLEAVLIPTLSPGTTYTVNYIYPDWANNPPTCSAPARLPLGTFKTQ